VSVNEFAGKTNYPAKYDRNSIIRTDRLLFNPPFRSTGVKKCLPSNEPRKKYIESKTNSNKPKRMALLENWVDIDRGQHA
jgi:hypothetical protein